jgi:hypothetical protein
MTDRLRFRREVRGEAGIDAANVTKVPPQDRLALSSSILLYPIQWETWSQVALLFLAKPLSIVIPTCTDISLKRSLNEHKKKR